MRGRTAVDPMQRGFVPGRSTTDAVFVLRRVQEEYLEKNKEFWYAFVDLKKAYDSVPRDVLWWALRRQGVPESLVSVVKAMYREPVCVVKLGVVSRRVSRLGRGYTRARR